MSGIVAVCCHELSRFAAFGESIANLRKPDGTRVVYKTGMNVALNRKAAVTHAIAWDYDWVFFVDDDMVFPEDALERLLAHNLPVVGSLYFNRNPPFYGMAFGDRNEQGWAPVSLKEAPEKGLVDVVACGTGGLLVKTEVLRAIPADTWFDHDTGTEDLPFCERIIQAGYKIYVDLEATMGHVSTYIVWPDFSKDEWKAGVWMTEKHQLLLELGE